jgi:predicted NBD/HSP70 family sugar kinase
MQRSPTIVVTRGKFGPAAGRVLEQVRGQRLATRDELARLTGLSPATVTRAVASLVEGGLLRERPDRVAVGAVGRPGVPVEVDTEEYVTVGVHLGSRLLTVAIGDPTGRVVASTSSPRDPAEAPDFEGIGRQVVDLMRAHPGRVPLAAGLVAPWRDLGLDARGSAAELAAVLGLDLTTSDHVAAIAAAEYVHRRHGTGGVTAYLYVRHTAGFAVALDKGGQTEVSRTASLTHFPTRDARHCACGRHGCVEVSLTDHAVARAAHEEGIVATPTIEAVYATAAGGSLPGRQLLTRRARLLGETAAVVRDMVDPDRMILVGQAFTGYPPVLDEVVAAFGANTLLPPMDLSFTRFGTGIQALAACTIALGPVYDDPLAALPVHRRRPQRRRPPA